MGSVRPTDAKAAIPARDDEEPPPFRSALMAKVRSKNTTPELTVRRAAHRLGYRFRLHRKDLPGTPDVVFPRLGVALFVHGCFWHRHAGCKRCTTPKTRANFWSAKFEANVRRDKLKAASLKEMGWRVLTIWECETQDADMLEAILRDLAATHPPGAKTP